MQFTESAFLRLPNELKINVVDQLSDRRDLFNLCLTCRGLEAVTSTLLYRDVNVQVPPDNTLAWNLGGLPLLREDVVASIKSLGLRNGHTDIRYPSYDRRQRHYGSIVLLLSDFLQKMPERRLRRLSFLHQTPVTEKILAPLFEKQAVTLEELEIYYLKCLELPPLQPPNGLTIFECRTFTDGKQIAGLLQSSRQSLRALRLGQEKFFVERYMSLSDAYISQEAEPLEQTLSIIPLREFTNLQELELYGINLKALVPSSYADDSFFLQLQRLSLESCSGASGILETFGDVYREAKRASKDIRKPALRDFRLRHEAPDALLRSSLAGFLGSFEGLESLSLLFENATFLQKPSTLIRDHAKTLKRLVLECRAEPRQYIAHDTSRPFGVGGSLQALWEESVREICQLCPNLEELGTGFPWSDELIRLRPSAFANLTHLRTLHIRNFPESNSIIQFGDYSIKQFAQKFLDWTFPVATTSQAPPLEILAIGPTLYESRWKVDMRHGLLPEYLKTYYFCVDWQMNRFGQWLPLLTSVTEKCVERIRDQRPLEGLFESVWVR